MTANENDNATPVLDAETENKLTEAEHGFNLGLLNAEKLYLLVLEQVKGKEELTDNNKTGFMMGFLQYFVQTYDTVVKVAEADLAAQSSTVN